MRSSHVKAAMRTAGRYLGAWAAITFFVGLVSFTFTFLGTITCAVLVGMMLGAFKGAKWFSVLVSLVFPAMMFGITRSPGSELTPRQIGLLVLVCFGAFWVTWAVSAFVFFCEQKGVRSPHSAAETPQLEAVAQGGLTAAFEPPIAATPAAEPSLAQLQGNWVWEAASATGKQSRKVIQIREANLELKTIDVTGRITLLAKGEVTLRSTLPS